MQQNPTQSESGKRHYHRRTDEERLQELQKKLEEMQNKVKEREAKQRPEPSPVVKKIPRVIKSLREFGAFAHLNGRLDLYNSTTAFVAMLDRTYHEEMDVPVRESEPAEDERE